MPPSLHTWKLGEVRTRNIVVLVGTNELCCCDEVSAFSCRPSMHFYQRRKKLSIQCTQSGSRMDVLTRESISFKAGRSASDASSCCADWAERYGLTKVLSGAFLTKDARELWKCHGIHKVEEGHKPGLKQWCNENKLRHVPSHGLGKRA